MNKQGYRWVVDYSVRMTDGTVIETAPGTAMTAGTITREFPRRIVEAFNFFKAVEAAKEHVLFPLMMRQDVSQVAITNVGIMTDEDDPFRYSDMMTEVEGALAKLGYSEVERFELVLHDESRASVVYRNEPIGIYDFARHTFVD